VNAPETIDFSVIVPLTDEHGKIADTLGCLDSWVSGQTHDRSRYEVIVASDGAKPDLDARVRGMLAPLDSLIVHRTPQPFELYTIAARRARGRFLFLAESHTRGHPDCLREMLACLEAGGYDLAACRLVGVNHEGHWLSRLDRRKNDEFHAAQNAAGDWRRARINGSAVRRAAYEAVGGFEHEFDKFAPIALAARLEEAGRTSGVATESIVYHVDSPALTDIVTPLGQYVLGEMAYRARHPAGYCERYFGYSPHWAQRGDLRRDLARRRLAAAVRALPAALRRPRALRYWLRIVGQLAPTAALGARWLRHRAWWSARMAIVRAWLWRRDGVRSYAAYEQARRHFDAHFRAAALEAHFGALPEPEASDQRLALADVEADRLAGFYPVEDRPEAAFRWSKPAAAIEIALDPGDYAVTLTTLPLRPADQPADATVYFDGHRLGRVSGETYRLTRSMFRGRGERHTLVLVCAPFLPDRELGLPLTFVTFEAS
jgi:hypothetical protein